MSRIKVPVTFDELVEHYEATAKQVESLQTQLDEAKKERVCRWTKLEDDGWETSCEKIIEVHGDRPATLFCWNCGGKVEVE